MQADTAEKKHNRRVRAWHSMTEAAQPLAQEVRALLIESSRRSFMIHWEIGNRANAVRSDPERYGENGLELVRSYFRCHGTRLDDDARVAANFERTRVLELAAREMRNGHHLAWKHLVLLAGVPAGQVRDQLIEATFAEALTVAELERRIVSLSSERDGGSLVGAPRLH